MQKTNTESDSEIKLSNKVSYYFNHKAVHETSLAYCKHSSYIAYAPTLCCFCSKPQTNN